MDDKTGSLTLKEIENAYSRVKNLAEMADITILKWAHDMGIVPERGDLLIVPSALFESGPFAPKLPAWIKATSLVSEGYIIKGDWLDFLR